MKSRDTNDRGRVKVRFLEIEAEGGSDAILEGLRTVSAAFSKEGTKIINGHPPTRILSSNNVARPTGPKNGELFEEIAQPETQPEEDADMVKAEPFEEAGESKPKTKRKLPSANLLPEIDIEKGNPNLRAFAEAKQPKTDHERYMICAAWLKKEYGLNAINIDHIHTCFMGLGWKPPEDLGSAFRKMKNKRFNQNGNEWELHSSAEALVARLPQRD